MIVISIKKVDTVIMKGIKMNTIITTAHDDKHLDVPDFIKVANQVVVDYIAQPNFVGNVVVSLIKRAVQKGAGAQLVIKSGDDTRQTALILHSKSGLMLVDYNDISLTSQRLIGLSAAENVRPYVCDVVYSWPALSLDDYLELSNAIEFWQAVIDGERI